MTARAVHKARVEVGHIRCFISYEAATPDETVATSHEET